MRIGIVPTAIRRMHVGCIERAKLVIAHITSFWIREHLVLTFSGAACIWLLLRPTTMQVLLRHKQCVSSPTKALAQET